MIIGHQRQWNYLKKIIDSKKIPHALIFSGESKLGKKTLAFEFIKLLFGKDAKYLQRHPDFFLVEPAENEIQIAQIRELIWKLSLKASLAPIKAAIIDQAHLMNEEAQNCFLKTLEEPKGDTVLILITEYPEFLFPTILSRCENLKFYPVKNTEVENYLKSQDIKGEKIKEIMGAAEGKPGLAIDFFLNPQKLEGRIQRKKELQKLLKSHLSYRFQYAKEISKEADLKEILDIWLSYFRDNLLSQLALRKPESLNKLTLQRDSGLMLSRVEALKNIIRKIQNTYFLISTTNINSRLAIDLLMLEI